MAIILSSWLGSITTATALFGFTFHLNNLALGTEWQCCQRDVEITETIPFATRIHLFYDLFFAGLHTPD